MPKKAPKKTKKPVKMAWALVGTWKRYSLHRVKADAEVALDAWKVAREAEGLVVKGSKARGSYTAYEPDGPAKASAGIQKLADHPVCYIGVLSTDVPRLRALETSDPEAFEAFSARAKALSADWSQVEAL
jgi:hypothetical protein